MRSRKDARGRLFSSNRNEMLLSEDEMEKSRNETPVMPECVNTKNRRLQNEQNDRLSLQNQSPFKPNKSVKPKEKCQKSMLDYYSLN